ncbi:vicilin-like seed storage protein At2g28490 [Wolffia australiana]
MTLFFVLLMVAVAAADERGTEEEGRMFILEKWKEVVKTEAGEVRVVKGSGWAGAPSPMHLGFISMEPNSLYVPQYLDATLTLFIRRGEAKVGWVYKDGLEEKKLKTGDIYVIPSGSTFYMTNTGKGQRLHIIASISTADTLGLGEFQSSFIAGGSNPASVLAGFDKQTLAAAFNISSEEVESVMRRGRGPIIFAEEAKKKRIRLMLRSWAAMEENKGKVTSPESYNLYERAPDFKNDYGWSVAVGEEDYQPLMRAGVGIFLVNLTAGAMLAPHVNPVATEYGVVLNGEGSVHVVFPNGTAAMKAEVREGDAFWAPRFFPMCHVAARSGAMEFFGFASSGKKNRPQFLAGSGSVLRALAGPELAAAFGSEEEELLEIVEAQRESTILPPWPTSSS